MYSGAIDATIGRHEAGVATVTRPAPERRAPIAARWAAPVLPRDPATTVTRPKSPLCESAARGSTSSRSCSGVSSSTCFPSSLSITSYGMPMSAMTTSPAYASPGGRISGSFGTASVTVIEALMQSPMRCGVSADRPLGMSMATIGMSDALTSAMTVSSMPVTAVLSPVPKIASTISVHCEISEKCSSQLCSSAISTTVTPRRPRMSRLMRASPRTSPREPTTKTAVSMPRCSSVRATTKPSPPLLPRPQRTATRPASCSSYADSIAATTWRPAFSISTSDGIPISSMVKRSASRICAAVRMRIRWDVTEASSRRTFSSRRGGPSGPPRLRAVYHSGYGRTCMAATVFVNGRISGERDAVVPVFDHGFIYGEGVYETLRTYNRRLFLYDRHVRRLRRSAAMIALDIPFTDDGLEGHIADTMAAASFDVEAYVRVLVTRGVGELTYDPKATPTPTLVIIVKPQVDPAPDAYTLGVRVAIVDIVRNHPGSVNPIIKSNNLMNSALAMQEALRRGAFEGIMRNYRGELTECTTANLFIVKKGVALTPPLDAGLLPGITREFLFDIGRRSE